MGYSFPSVDRKPRGCSPSGFLRVQLIYQRLVVESKGMNWCGRSRCQICKFVMEGRDFSDMMGNKKYFINYDFDCDFVGIIEC